MGTNLPSNKYGLLDRSINFVLINEKIFFTINYSNTYKPLMLLSNIEAQNSNNQRFIQNSETSETPKMNLFAKIVNDLI